MELIQWWRRKPSTRHTIAFDDQPQEKVQHMTIRIVLTMQHNPHTHVSVKNRYNASCHVVFLFCGIYFDIVILCAVILLLFWCVVAILLLSYQCLIVLVYFSVTHSRIVQTENVRDIFQLYWFQLCWTFSKFINLASSQNLHNTVSVYNFWSTYLTMVHIA